MFNNVMNRHPRQ